MTLGFRILRKRADGKSTPVAWRETRAEADRLVVELAETWPAEYVIEEAAQQSSQDVKT